ncbi:hypothetical protein QWY16_18935 [Planococcus shenhongbingii]|uniref:Uncharacterized protein n=1 Tax=Planococcus shenhongbingii TaxID=3058398 RepID=A0ABT8NC23_9BACL|nr:MULTISPECIES: hypothetical protein [unclassified Planococcus (in: firmicutes)]MDN7245441.1 hypothetical protein [Planococcus sp. N017]WKA58540.1 hypothetical protein QWY16_18935 [Planococcus sp. N016]
MNREGEPYSFGIHSSMSLFTDFGNMSEVKPAAVNEQPVTAIQNQVQT